MRSTLPIGAGLSSSAALEVAVATALCAVADFEVEPLDLARALQRAEHRAVGVPSGIMDQAASLLGRAGHALLLDTGTLEYEHVPLPPQLALARRRVGRLTAARVVRVRQTGGASSRRVTPPAFGISRRRTSACARSSRSCASPDSRGSPSSGRVFAEGHASLRDDFEVTIPELDALVELARRGGCRSPRA